MALNTTTFIIILISTIVLMGLLIWLKFRFENKKR
jgi:hypothetical protein